MFPIWYEANRIIQFYAQPASYAIEGNNLYVDMGGWTATLGLREDPVESFLSELSAAHTVTLEAPRSKMLPMPAAPLSPSSDGTQTPEVVDDCGIDDYAMFSNRTEAEEYLNDNASCNKEKFFYINEDNSVLVGPWNDATGTITSPQYADRFENGSVTYGGKSYEVEYFVHTHPDNPQPSYPYDYDVYNYFNYWNIPTLIYCKGNYYYYDNRLEPIQFIIE